MWIDSDKDFSDWCREAQTHGAVAIDTEFVWTKTYYPDLGLIQMAWDRQNSALIDVLAITDTTPLERLLANQNVTKIFHEAASDLPILRRWCGGNVIPKRIFDTRIAAGFSGLTATLSLNRLLTEILGITLPKTETRTDWLQRPLTPQQLEYASGDVDYMTELYERLTGKMDELQNTPWFQDVMQEYSTPEMYAEIAPENAWKRIPGHGRIEGKNLAVLCQLSAWREQHAKDNNIARPRIIDDDQIRSCAEHPPKTLAELILTTGMWTKNAERYGNDILRAIQTGLAQDNDAFTNGHAFDMDAKVLKKRTDRIKNLVAKRAEARQIDPMLVAVRRDMEAFVIAANAHKYPFKNKLLEGWRHQLLGDAIDQLAKTNFDS